MEFIITSNSILHHHYTIETRKYFSKKKGKFSLFHNFMKRDETKFFQSDVHRRPVTTVLRNGNVYVNGDAIKFQIPNLHHFDLEDIDVILISNYMNMLALPYVTERTSFKGKVYATEPTKQIGRYKVDQTLISS